MMRKIFFILLVFFVTSIKCQDNGLQTSGSDRAIIASGGISVTIGGTFIVNGSFTASPYDRVDQFITRLLNQAKAQQLSGITDNDGINLVTAKFDNIAKRNIKLKRNNGEELILDLEKFRLTGDFRNNPHLRNEDVLIFPKYDDERDFVSIDGAVNNPVKFQFVEGDKLSDALLFAQGISKVYQNPTKAEITRLSYSGQNDNSILIDVNSNFSLQAGDRIRILADETDRKDYKVLVLGEVNKPGYIPISKDETTIKQLIEKAGGFKPSASLRNAEIIRSTDNYSLLRKSLLIKNFQQNRPFMNGEKGDPFSDHRLSDHRLMEELLMSRMSHLTEEDTLYFSVDNDLRLIRGSGLVDFTKLDSDTVNGSRFIMRDGDIVLVPEKRDLVYVFGQVANAGYVKYVEGKDVNFYIEEAGGLGELAKDFDEISVIKAKSRTWVRVDSKDLKIEPGDYIWVPKETPRTFSYYFDKYMTRIGQVAGVVGTVVTIILLTRSQN